jgi:hypothetical protein
MSKVSLSLFRVCSCVDQDLVIHRNIYSQTNSGSVEIMCWILSLGKEGYASVFFNSLSVMYTWQYVNQNKTVEDIVLPSTDFRIFTWKWVNVFLKSVIAAV